MKIDNTLLIWNTMEMIPLLKFLQYLEKNNIVPLFSVDDNLLVIDLKSKKIFSDRPNYSYTKYILGTYYSDIPGIWSNSYRINTIRNSHTEGLIPKKQIIYKIPEDLEILKKEISLAFDKKNSKFEFIEFNIELL